MDSLPLSHLGSTIILQIKDEFLSLLSIYLVKHHFAHEGPISKSYGFSSSHVRNWELHHKADWGPKQWCFRIVVLEKTRDVLTQKKAGFPCSGLNAGSYFISEDEGMTKSPVETLEKAIVLHLFWTEGLTSFWHIERCAVFMASKGDDAWLFVKIDRNSNITVPTNKGRLASRLTFSSVRTMLPSLV